MVWLSFKSRIDGQSAAMVADDLKQANVEETTTGLQFDYYRFDEDIIVRAVIDLFHRAFHTGRQLGCLRFQYCTGRVDEILHMASSLDMFDKIGVYGCSDLAQNGFWSISSAMKFNKHLTKLDLAYMKITRQQVAALGAGLSTSNSQTHFKELYIRRVRFADGAITELASGLKENSSLCILNVERCNLEDTELAELVDAVEFHSSLKELLLGGNRGQEHALVALGNMLASRNWQLETLDFSWQARDHSGLTGRLGMLTEGLRWNEKLTSLNLSSNQLVDKDIDLLGQILVTCRLRTFDLSDNIITLSGFVSLTQNIPKSLKSFDFNGNAFGKEEAACHILALFEEQPQLWEDGFDWSESKSPTHQKIQHYKDLNRRGRILLAGENSIPLSVWPIVLARANTLPEEDSRDSDERTSNAIFHLLQGPALMQRRFDRDFSKPHASGPRASDL
jgi:hypothetical protein